MRGGDLLTAVPAAGGVPASVRCSNGLVLSHVLCRVNSLRNLLINIFFKFPRAIKLTGPFVTMIFAMITGDMFTFSIIYIIFLFGFSQAFHFIMKSTDEEGMYANYMTTWIALFHMTLGEYEVVLLYIFFGKNIYYFFNSTTNLMRVPTLQWPKWCLFFSKS